MRTVLSAIMIPISLMLILSCGSVIDFGNLVNGKSLTNKSVSILSPSANDFAADMVPIEADLNGVTIDELSRVELFIGGSLKATYTLPPYVYSWDTSAFSDGPVEIKFKATLKNTIKLEASVTVNVQKGIFVSTSGSDFNPGTKTLPLKTIQVAVDKAFALGVKGIYVEKGTYTPGNGLNASGPGITVTNQSVNLIGGYNPDFNTRPGMSDLKGNSALLHIISLSNANNSSIVGFILREGIANGGSLDAYGGGLYFSYSTNCVVSNTVLMNNGGTYAAGAMLFYCMGSFFNMIVTNNTSSSAGGGINMNSCTNVTVIGNISWNRCAGGPQGGLEIWVSSNITISAVFSNNQAASTGGGISMDASAGVFLNNCTVVNSASGSYGGGIYINTSADINLNNCTITNGASGNYGGGMYIASTSNVNISGCSINSNVAAANGGGIFIDTSTVQITGSHINNNTANVNFGGGIYLNNSKCSIVSSSVNGNQLPNGDGGGILVRDYSFLDLISCDISGNNAFHGGGIYSFNIYSMNLLNCTLTNTRINGGINAVIIFQYWATQTNTVISNCVFGGTNNSATYGIYEYTGEMILQYIMNNTFITNCLGNLYYDIGASHIVTNSPTGWQMINNNLYSGAAIASGNTVAAQ